MSQTGCCAAGIPFDLNTQNCCYDGVHPDSEYICVLTDTEIEPSPKPFRMENESHKFETIKEFIVNVTTPFNTLLQPPTPEIECTYANENYGCLNGYPYDWSVSSKQHTYC